MKQLECLRIAIFSFVVALLGITQAAAQEDFLRVIGLKDLSARRTCTCSWNVDCRVGGRRLQFCDQGGCTETDNNTGTCRAWAVGDFSSPVFFRVVDLYFQAFITSARGDGGPPNMDLVRRAQDQRLTIDEHFAVQMIVHNALDITLGFDFITPRSSCIGSDDNQIDPGGLGQIRLAAKDARREGIELAEIVHQGLIAAIKANAPDEIAKPISLFWKKHPNYKPRYSGRCWSEGISNFPYKTAEECQIAELTDMLTLLLLPEAETPDMNRSRR